MRQAPYVRPQAGKRGGAREQTERREIERAKTERREIEWEIEAGHQQSLQSTQFGRETERADLWIGWEEKRAAPGAWLAAAGGASSARPPLAPSPLHCCFSALCFSTGHTPSASPPPSSAAPPPLQRCPSDLFQWPLLCSLLWPGNFQCPLLCSIVPVRDGWADCSQLCCLCSSCAVLALANQ